MPGAVRSRHPDPAGDAFRPALFTGDGERRRECDARAADHVHKVLAPEFARFGPAEQAITDAVSLITSWVSWEYMRTILGRTASEAEQNLVGALRAIFESKSATTHAHLAASDDYAPTR